MKKYLSLLKASMSYDMNIFKYTNNVSCDTIIKNTIIWLERGIVW